MRFITTLLLTLALASSVAAQSTSPDPQPQYMVVLPQTPGTTITFSEFPRGTSISNQYQNFGILFSGSGPFITGDGANPTSPVLSGSPQFQGDIVGTFVNPNTGDPTIVQSFTLDAGYFDEIGSTRIEWFDPNGFKLGQRINSHYGIERLNITGGNIASWKIAIVENEPAGYAIDNVSSASSGSAVLFREENEDGTFGSIWIPIGGNIPGSDHCGFLYSGLVYESHPSYGEGGVFVSADLTESINIQDINGVQSQFTKNTFSHVSHDASTKVIDFEEVPIDDSLAALMVEAVETKRGSRFLSLPGSEPEDYIAGLAPSLQKGGNNTFTCVGLVEWSAEEVDHNSGQGFIPDQYESFFWLSGNPFGGFETVEIPLLSPSLLKWAIKGEDLLSRSVEWLQGFFDPVDFIITDPLGRRLGFVEGVGYFNEIPNSFYTGNGDVEQFLIPFPVPGNYSIEYVGVGETALAAIASSVSQDGIYEHLDAGETKDSQIRVQATAGCMGDVDYNSVVNSHDVSALRLMLNRFTDGLGHPGDLDGDGLISNIDISMLEELIGLMANAPPIADAGEDQTVECANSTGTTITLDGTGSTDPDGDPITFTWMYDGEVISSDAVFDYDFGFGDHLVELTVEDGAGELDNDEIIISVVDTTPPNITVTVSPEVLWPPNHKMVNIEYTVTVEDVCDEMPAWELVDLVSNEPDDGLGDGTTEPDIMDAEFGTTDTNVRLRAERAGITNGRTYVATFQATDSFGNTSTAQATVYVPHDQSGIGTVLGNNIGIPEQESELVLMVPGASLWGKYTPTQLITFGETNHGERTTLEPLSANICNTAGAIYPTAYYVKELDNDEHKDVLVAFSRDELLTLWANSTDEDGPPVMALEIGEGKFLILDMSNVQESDIDLGAMVEKMRAEGEIDVVQTQDNTEILAARKAGLIGAAPNPFNPSTTISYYIPDSRHVELAIFDISGRRINRLVSQNMVAGEHSVVWNGTDARGGRVSSGIYFYRLTAGSLVDTKRMILIK